jgi:hypothetical protein
LTKSSSALSACSNSAARMMDHVFVSSRSAFAWALAVRSSTSSLLQRGLGAIGFPGWAHLLLALVSGMVIWSRNVWNTRGLRRYVKIIMPVNRANNTNV